VLVEHRIDDMDESLVAVEDSMPSGEQIALEPALALVLAEHFHHTTGGREKLVVRHGPGIPLALGRFEEGLQAVGECLVGAKDPKIPLLIIQLRHIAQETPEHMRVADAAHPWRGHIDSVLAEIRQPQIAEHNAAVGVGIRAHAPFTPGGKFGQFRFQASALIEEFLRPVAHQPVFQQLEVFLRRWRRYSDWNLMRPERALDLQAIDDLRPRPPLG
jgi:hypothetical protein